MSLFDAIEITKHYNAIAVLAGCSVTVDEGESVGLIGPNGAGKTTFFNCVGGILQPDAGRVLLDGTDISRLPVYRRARLGLGRTFQRSELFAGMSVRDHLLVAALARLGDGRILADLLHPDAETAGLRAQADETLDLLGLREVADVLIEGLSLATGRLVELGRALMTRPRVLLLDEPSSGLDREESLRLSEVLARLRTELGTGILLVEHDLELVRRAVDRLYVLDNGHIIASGPTERVMSDPAVRDAYLGRLRTTS